MPSLPGCISQGETREEAVVNTHEAIDLYIEVLVEDGIPEIHQTGMGVDEFLTLM